MTDSDVGRVLAELGARLDHATETFRSNQQWNGGRLGCMEALAALIIFSDQLGWGQDRRMPLLQLFHALQTAEDGAVDPLLTVNRRAGAPPLSLAELQQRGYLAAAVEALFRNGVPLKQAAKWVAERSHEMPAAARVKQAALWKAVRTWRVTAMGGNIHNDTDAIAFRAACDALDKGPMKGKAAAEWLVLRAATLGKTQETPPPS